MNIKNIKWANNLQVKVKIKNSNDDRLKCIMSATWTQVSSADRQGRRSWRGGKRSFSRDRQVATAASPPATEGEHWHQIFPSTLTKTESINNFFWRDNRNNTTTTNSNNNMYNRIKIATHLTTIISKLAHSRQLLQHLLRDQRTDVAKWVSALRKKMLHARDGFL